MKFRYLAALFCLIVAGLFSSAQAASVGGHGVVYFTYDLGTYSSNIPWSLTTNNWYTPGRNFKTPIGLYNINPTLADSQLAAMRASGMDYIVLQFGMRDLSVCAASGACYNGFPDDWVWGELIDSSLGTMHPMHEANLRALLQRIVALGFRNVVIRFTDGAATQWTSWDEVAYSHSWNYIVKVHLITDQELAGSVTGAIYDLGGESAGNLAGQNLQFMQRLWQDYTYIFGSSDTFGFSSIANDANVSVALASYGTVRPPRYAFTAYGDVYAGLTSVWNNLPASERTKPIMLVETYHNDATTASQIARFLGEHPTFNLFAVTQWPLNRAPPCNGCDTNVSESAVSDLSTSTQLSAMAPLVAKFSQEPSNPALMSFSDVNCATTTTATCTIQGNFNYWNPPTAMAYQVYVSLPGQPRKLWACLSVNASSQAGWIVRNIPYLFEYFKTANCSSSVVGLKPDATARVYVR
ncbi:hypothetical protein [Luteibacter sp. dw_328]|uniref:hypothetical protein n=1 Tax=Luteibacter sp. dw_328 TaxID=2719796 RepID=UPI001BD61646|nr:hypothetical protein [Luteibacter sp. dw_328]